MPLKKEETAVLSDGGTKIWVKSQAIDAIRNPKVSRFSSSTNSNSSKASSSSLTSSSNSHTKNELNHNHLGRPAWSWKSAVLVSSSPTATTIQDDLGQISLKPDALQDGTVLMANEFPLGDENSSTTENDPYVYPQDLITLTHLHEPAVVHCLERRYSQDIIYTATGPVLIALNPFQSIRGLYGEVTMRKYWEHSEGTNTTTQLPPHVYSIADDSFRNMMRQLDMNRDDPNTLQAKKCDQSILVSGESGAGKTVTAKYVMKYLAALSQRQQQQSARKPLRAYQQVQQQRQQQQGAPPQSVRKPPSSPALPSWALNPSNSSRLSLSPPTSPKEKRGGDSSIESQVLQSNPILESFGNARTIRNDNSSRFGKFLSLQFHDTGRLLGARIETYLLEKVRLMTQTQGERNYHVFYEVFCCPDYELQDYCLAPTATPQDFRMLASGTYSRRDGVEDRDTYRALRSAMSQIAFDEETQRDVFCVVAAFLHASNLTFFSEQEVTYLDGNNVHLQPVCHLLGLEPEDLNEALCFYQIQAGRQEGVRRGRSIAQAEKGLEALLKATYGALFTFLVRVINESIAFYPEHHEEDNHGHASRPAATIGVLDIFGFESFAVNSFEQLCINYCNEALQQQFNAFVLKNEQEEYEREGIEWSFIEFPENKDVLELIDKRGSGILNILDDQCRAPGTTDRTFASDVYNKCKEHRRFNANRTQTAALQFEVHHYAGPVEYTTDGFVEKNRDELPKESTELLLNSTNIFVQILAEILTEHDVPPPQSQETPSKFRRTDSSSAARLTVGAQFRRQLRDLRSKIDNTTPHYIRCLKPNDHLVPNHFDPMVVAEQLRCGGILEAVRVSRAGFPQHYPHADFVRRYGAMAPRDVGSSWKGSSSSAPTMNGGGWNGGARKSWNGGSPTPSTARKWETPGRGGGYRSNSFGKATTPPSMEPEEKVVDYKAKCKELIKVLCRQIQRFEKEEAAEYGAAPPEDATVEDSIPKPTTPKAKTYSYSTSTPPPAWAKSSPAATPPPTKPTVPKTAPAKSKYPPWAKQQQQETTAKPSSPAFRSSSTPSFRRGPLFSAELAKAGMQMGKTKVFLRHKAFEILERLRSRNQTAAATRINNTFRMYLARLAYIPVRDAYREEMRALGSFKEHKEEYPDESSSSSASKSQNGSIGRRSSGEAFHLIQKYESEVRASIHLNPRGLFLKQKAKPAKKFKWVLADGIWVINPALPVGDSNSES